MKPSRDVYPIEPPTFAPISARDLRDHKAIHRCNGNHMTWCGPCYVAWNREVDQARALPLFVLREPNEDLFDLEVGMWVMEMADGSMLSVELKGRKHVRVAWTNQRKHLNRKDRVAIILRWLSAVSASFEAAMQWRATGRRRTLALGGA